MADIGSDYFALLASRPLARPAMLAYKRKHPIFVHNVNGRESLGNARGKY
jgi:hypothetical protein